MTPPTLPPWAGSYLCRKGLCSSCPRSCRMRKDLLLHTKVGMVMSLHVFPFMPLCSKRHAEYSFQSGRVQARCSGRGSGARMRKLFLPLLSGTYAIGALLVFVKSAV